MPSEYSKVRDQTEAFLENPCVGNTNVLSHMFIHPNQLSKAQFVYVMQICENIS